MLLLLTLLACDQIIGEPIDDPMFRQVAPPGKSSKDHALEQIALLPDPVPVYTRELDAKRRVVEGVDGTIAVLNDKTLCPDAIRVADRESKDEFDEKANSADFAAAVEACGEQLKAVVDEQLKPVMAIDVPITKVSDYDFELGRFTLDVDLQAIPNYNSGPTSLRVGPGSCRSTAAVLGMPAAGEGFDIVHTSDSTDAEDVRVRLPVPEAEGKAWKKMLSDRKRQLRVQLLFEPGPIGQSGIGCGEGRDINAATGLALAYRVISDDDLLRAWTPLGQ